MPCFDYLTVDQLKSLGVGGALTDAALALLLMGASDFVDEKIGTPFGRALRAYYPDLSDGTTGCTVAVTAASLDFVVTGGPNAGASSFAFALWPTLGQLADAVNGAGYGIVVKLLHSPYVADQPSTALSLRSATSIFGIEHWAVLCVGSLSVCLSGGGNPFLFLPFQPGAYMASVSEDGVALTQGTHYYVHKEGYLERTATGCTPYVGSCGGYACDCPTPGCWSCSYPCNVAVVYTPRHWAMAPTDKVALALVELLKVQIASGGYQRESIGRYSYDFGGGAPGGALGLFWQLIEPLQSDAGVVMQLYPGFMAV